MATCHLSFENFWGEELKYVTISCSESPFNIKPEEKNLIFLSTISHVKDKQTASDDLSFYYNPGQKTYWRVQFSTLYDQSWISSHDFSCTIKPEDNHNITLGVNGESKRLYAAFPASSSCSTSISRL
ncbi:TPA: hypothetical protein VEO38_003807 [Providencia alcalifaciens]|nr:hypothetical protein [Providencia alcalifaciens]HEQ1860208.1 hypothetical protein [Providencia alcalifaciens]